MSITTAKLIGHRRWNGSLDPALPSGVWLAEVEGTGNASGGDQSVDIQFALAGNPNLNANIYSIEQLYISQSAVADAIALVNLSNMDNEGGVPMDARFAVLLRTTEGGLGAIRPRDAVMFKGLFIGAQRVTGIDGSLSCIIDNVNGNALTMGAQGYFWTPRSVLVDGGPQRPSRAMYGV